MAKSAIVFGICAFVLGMWSCETASAVTFRFDPNALIQAYPGAAGTSDTEGQNKATQVNARRVHQRWANTWYETFYNPAGPQTQPDSYNTYVNWATGLGEGEGISGFNIWMQDNPRARSWGETTVWNPYGAAPTGTADAAGLWNVEAIANPWGPGWLVQWWTDDPANYINSTSTIGEFSFSGTAYHDLDADGYDSDDPLVQYGDEVRIWFGVVNHREGTEESNSLHFNDEGWGTLSPAASPFSPYAGEGYGSGYEGVLGMTAVPEPSALLLVGLGIAGYAVLRKKRS